MTGLSWLSGKCWWEVSRDERYFCAELYHLIREDVGRFIRYLNSNHDAELDSGANWEVVYEACFYRDLWHMRDRSDTLFSPKRTFDLALFSDNDILLIEAKAHQGFNQTQLRAFARDADEVLRLTGVRKVRLAALVSSAYQAPRSVADCFDGPHLQWRDLAQFYGNNEKLLRADKLFEANGTWSAANNVGGHMKGTDLLAAFESGERFLVGRGGGLYGPRFCKDVATGSWRNQSYETNRDAAQPPNQNWFTLEEFARCVATKRAE
jgi:hypothetical protein